MNPKQNDWRTELKIKIARQGNGISMNEIIADIEELLIEAEQKGRDEAVAFIRGDLVPINKDIGSYAVSDTTLESARSTGSSEENDVCRGCGEDVGNCPSDCPAMRYHGHPDPL